MDKEKIESGGEFLIKETEAADIFIPEELNEEQQMIIETCEGFLETEVFPNLDRIDAQEEGLMRNLISKAGEYGLLGVSLPEEYEGFNQDFVTSMLASDAMGAGFSFSVAYSAHTGIGTLPILYYGSEEQKNKYLAKLATGEWAAAYCLTEPNAGSDANSGKTKAVLSEDGKHYILNGQKMWITNGGFADIQTVFAKIDNDRVYSAFIIEKDWEGVVINPEERKMGIKGSSTVQIFYNDVKVPVENLLGKRGGGFRIALNILHMGRIKLGGTVLGAARRAITQSVQYANERKQFGRPISSFGAIKYKLGEQVIRTFTTESAVYRVSKNIDDAADKLMAEGKEKPQATIEAIGQYAIEAALLKVFGSEALNYVVDEAVQIFGGMGFSSETDIDRAYRDSRINRIFEGTNEINRLLVADTTIKKSLRVGFDVVRYAKHVVKESDKEAEEAVSNLTCYEEKQQCTRNFKKAVLFILGVATDGFKKELFNEQEVLCNISDAIMQTYTAESTMLRVKKLEETGHEKFSGLYMDILNVTIYEAAALIRKAGHDAINALPDEVKDKEVMLERIDLFTKVQPVNTKDARRRIADKLIEDNRYSF
jgi:alkylation response protein AidB-like acyl-CoA dehydrogenase